MAAAPRTQAGQRAQPEVGHLGPVVPSLHERVWLAQAWDHSIPPPFWPLSTATHTRFPCQPPQQRAPSALLTPAGRAGAPDPAPQATGLRQAAKALRRRRPGCQPRPCPDPALPCFPSCSPRPAPPVLPLTRPLPLPRRRRLARPVRRRAQADAGEAGRDGAQDAPAVRVGAAARREAHRRGASGTGGRVAPLGRLVPACPAPCWGQPMPPPPPPSRTLTPVSVVSRGSGGGRAYTREQVSSRQICVW